MRPAFLPRRGIALIMTLLLLIILAVLVGQFSYSTKIDYYTAQNQCDEVQNHYALLSAVNQAIAYLQLDAMQEKESQEHYDALTDVWNKPQQFTVGTTQVAYTINDESSKFNITNLLQEPKPDETDDQKKPLTPAQQFERLIDLLQENQKIIKARTIRESLVDWLKNKNGKTELEGPFLNKAPILSCKELLLAKDMTKTILYGQKLGDSGNLPVFSGLIDYVTVWSDCKININTASHVMLQSLSDKIDAEQADKIVTYRERDSNAGEKQVFKKEDELQKVEGMSSDQANESIFPRVKDLITVRSHYFSIQAEAVTGRMSKRMFVVVYRSGKKISKLFCDEE
jgi:general secretion pathway protein K